MDLRNYKNLNSVKELNKYLERYTITIEKKEWNEHRGTSENKMRVGFKLKELDLENVTGDILNILEEINLLKEEYITKDFIGTIEIDNDKSFWQGDYEGETWTLIHYRDENNQEFEERMEIIKRIKEEIELMTSPHA